jgi:hypothetical protein
MPPISIDVFSEGKTEKGVIDKLCVRGICAHQMEERGGGGEDNMLSNLSTQLRRWFDLALAEREPLNILILRDLDSHEGKTIRRLCDSVSDRVKRHHPGAGLFSLANFDNAFKLNAAIPGLRLALHIANDCCRPEFIKTTIDDYVLKLALRQNTVTSFLASGQIGKSGVTTEQLIQKVETEIPALLDRNKIPLVEAKDFIRFYAAVLRAHTSPAVFAGKVLEHADEDDIRRVFASLLACIQFLGEDVESQ